MSKYKYKIKMPATLEEMETIKGDLEKLGQAVFVTSGNWRYLAFERDGSHGNVNESYFSYGDTSYIEIPEFNKELFLAIASIREDEDFYKGEYVIWEEDYSSGWFKKGDIVKLDEVHKDKVLGMTHPTDGKGAFTNGVMFKGRKATPEELIAHFSQQPKTNTETMDTEIKEEDWVKLLSDPTNYTNCVVGEKYQVIGIRKDEITVDNKEGPKRPRTEGWAHRQYWNTHYNNTWEKTTKPETMEKKIIGYKAPRDLFKGEVKKNTIYVILTGNDAMYKPKDEGSRNSLAKEIVEEWEPVYEEEEKVLTLGSNSMKVTVSKGTLKFRNGESTDIQNVVKLVEDITNSTSFNDIAGYSVRFDTAVRFIQIGCDGEGHKFSLGELIQVIEAGK